jgi:hypothetical protein
MSNKNKKLKNKSKTLKTVKNFRRPKKILEEEEKNSRRKRSD